MPPSNRTDADDLAVAVVLTLELAKIARVLLRLDHVTRFIVNTKWGDEVRSKKEEGRRLIC